MACILGFRLPDLSVIQYSPLLLLLAFGALLCTLYYVSVAIYNLYFHPLARYPGPCLAAASSLWYARALAKGTIAQSTLALHEYYGDVVRIAPDELSYVNPKNWKEIYGYRAGGKQEMIKDPRYHDTVKPTVTILTGDRDEHNYYRKMLSRPFSEKALKEQEYILHDFVNLFIKRVQEASQGGKKSINMVDWWNFLTFDVIGFLAYGEKFECLSNSKLHDWIDSSLSIATLMSLGQAARQLAYPFDSIYKSWAIPQSVYKHTKLHRQLVEEKLKSRLEHNPKHSDIMDLMVDTYKKGDLSFPTLWEHASLLTIGGSETSATLLAGATYYLAINPQVFAKLAAEIRETFPKDEDIDLASTLDCPYLLACMEESLRIYPPSPANHTRMVPAGGAMLEGQHVPGGICVGMPMYATFRSSSNWREPNSFAPERWTGDAAYAADKRHALQPFSYGPRNCLGRQLAYQEIRLSLAKLAWHFDLELCPESKNWADQKSFTFWAKPPLWVKMIPVKRE